MPSPLNPSSHTASALALESLTPAQLYFSLEGRINRRTYWLGGVLPLCLVGLVGTVLLNIAGLPAERAEGLVNLLLLWPGVAVSAKRWHDRNRSAAWVLIVLVPVVGWLWSLIDNGLLPGDAGDNRFGPPQAVATSLLD